jgi:hypothetical protein
VSPRTKHEQFALVSGSSQPSSRVLDPLRACIPPRPSRHILDSCWLVGVISAGSEDPVWKSCHRGCTEELFVTGHDKEVAPMKITDPLTVQLADVHGIARYMRSA